MCCPELLIRDAGKACVMFSALRTLNLKRQPNLSSHISRVPHLETDLSCAKKGKNTREEATLCISASSSILVVEFILNEIRVVTDCASPFIKSKIPGESYSHQPISIHDQPQFLSPKLLCCCARYKSFAWSFVPWIWTRWWTDDGAQQALSRPTKLHHIGDSAERGSHPMHNELCAS